MSGGNQITACSYYINSYCIFLLRQFVSEKKELVQEIPLLIKHVLYNVRAHLQGLLALGIRVLMHIIIFPAVA
jgi:hypothetical protein